MKKKCVSPRFGERSPNLHFRRNARERERALPGSEADQSECVARYVLSDEIRNRFGSTISILFFKRRRYYQLFQLPLCCVHFQFFRRNIEVDDAARQTLRALPLPSDPFKFKSNQKYIDFPSMPFCRFVFPVPQSRSAAR